MNTCSDPYVFLMFALTGFIFVQLIVWAIWVKTRPQPKLKGAGAVKPEEYIEHEK